MKGVRESRVPTCRRHRQCSVSGAEAGSSQVRASDSAWRGWGDRLFLSVREGGEAAVRNDEEEGKGGRVPD